MGVKPSVLLSNSPHTLNNSPRRNLLSQSLHDMQSRQPAIKSGSAFVRQMTDRCVDDKKLGFTRAMSLMWY